MESVSRIEANKARQITTVSAKDAESAVAAVVGPPHHQSARHQAPGGATGLNVRAKLRPLRV